MSNVGRNLTNEVCMWVCFVRRRSVTDNDCLINVRQLHSSAGGLIGQLRGHSVSRVCGNRDKIDRLLYVGVEGFDELKTSAMTSASDLSDFQMEVEILTGT